ncbi:MAG: hypothetical protein HYX67_14395 [Candidatus Melainabacteria bacterium]|nr:hypothetical protein [Candidatus Melainabacteria bacterium]
MQSLSGQSKLANLWADIRIPVISVLIVFYIGTSALYLSPPSLWRQRLLAPFWNFIEYTGLWQYYTVFSPPRSFNLYLEGEVELANGKTVIWKYPRVEQLGLVEKMQKERFRKLYNDIANEPTDGVLWPDLARYIARQVYAETGVRPVKVGLIRYWSDTPAPTSDPLPKPSTEYKSHKYFTFPIQAEDLK